MTRQMRMSLVVMMLMLLEAGIYARPAVAEEVSQDNNKWQFEITPYLFAAGMDGTVGMQGVSADVDMSFSDIWDHLDKAFMLFFSAQKGDWIFAFDGTYFSLEDEAASSWQGPFGNTNTAQLNVDVTEQIYAFSAGRRVLNKQTKVDILGVARYTSLDTNMTLAGTTGADLLPDGSRSVGLTESWWDAAVAVRVITPIANNWSFVGYADIGTGGSDLTYQLLAGVNWQISNLLSTKLGYRYFYQDYNKDDFKWDMANSGVYVGLGFSF